MSIRAAINRIFLLLYYDSIRRLAREGKVFSASKRFIGVSPDSSCEIVIVNDSNNDVQMQLLLIEVPTQAKTFLDIYHNSTIVSLGSEVDIVCKRLGYATSKMKAYSGGSYTPGEKAYEGVIPAGGGGPGGKYFMGGQSEVGLAFIVDPGHNIHIVVTNKDTATHDFSVRVEWAEE